MCCNVKFDLNRQDLVEEMTKPIWWIDRKGEIPAGQKEAYQQPIFQYHDVRFSRPILDKHFKDCLHEVANVVPQSQS